MPNLFVLTVAAVCLLTTSNRLLGQDDQLIDLIQQVEAQLDARVGVTVVVHDSDLRWEYQADHRFPMSSTFKTLACAALLARVDAGEAQLDRIVRFSKTDLVEYSPVTESKADTAGMTLGELCAATIAISDNTAGNLVLQAIGGPAALTLFVRSLGDDITRLDRWETELNEAVPGDSRDTTTPNAMARLLEELLFGTALSVAAQAQLVTWLKANTVGDALLRAGIPEDWQIGDKTGAGGYGSRSIAAVMWPPIGSPVIATIYITETEASFAARNAAIASIGRALAATVTD